MMLKHSTAEVTPGVNSAGEPILRLAGTHVAARVSFLDWLIARGVHERADVRNGVGYTALRRMLAYRRSVSM